MDTIYADFNNQDESHHVRLNLKKSREGLTLLGERLREGTVVWLADDEGRLRARLHLRADVWVGIPEWDTWQEVPFDVAVATPLKT